MVHRIAIALVIAALTAPAAAGAHPGTAGGSFAAGPDPDAAWRTGTRPTVELQRPRRALADPDADGRVTSEEAMEFFRRHFEALDRNRDDRLQERELLRLAVEDRRDASRRRDQLRSSFDKLDRDGDGRLSQDEFRRRWTVPSQPWTRQRLARLFASLDQDHDGVVDRERFMSTGRGYYSRCATSDGMVPLGRFLAGMPF